MRLIRFAGALLTASVIATSAGARTTSFGVNLSGYEYNGSKAGARQWFDYTTPNAAEFSYFAGKRLKLIRVPMAWERIQPIASGALDPTQVAIIRSFLKNASKAGVQVILDLHNYGRYNGQIASPSQLAGFWGKLATAVKGSPGLVGYGLMNEPHDMGGAWPEMAQAAVMAIRRVDVSSNLYVANNDGWGGVHQPVTPVKDPAGKAWAEGHLYFDQHNSGIYSGAWTPKSRDTIIHQVADFAMRAKAAGMEPLIGETGCPSDAASLALLDAELGEAAKDDVAVTYWLAGAWSGKDPSTVEPADGVDKPQMVVLAKTR